jgi:Uma2 family endonuclease
MGSKLGTVNRTPTLGEVLGSHELPFVVRELEAVLAAERERREKFYDWLTPSTKAEFINGEVIVHSPATFGQIRATGNLFSLLHTYVQRHHRGATTLGKALISLSRNDYRPDICFFGTGKEALLRPETTHFPAPDFMVEVLSESTEQRERTVKMQDYALHGVAE